MPIWHIDQLKTPQGNVDIDLIRNEANELGPHRGDRLEVRPLCENLAETIAHARTAMQSTSASTDTNLFESILGSSTAPSSSSSAPSPTLVPLARVHKLEAQMATLLYHIKTWIQRSIAKEEERLERNIS